MGVLWAISRETPTSRPARDFHSPAGTGRHRRELGCWAARRGGWGAPGRGGESAFEVELQSACVHFVKGKEPALATCKFYFRTCKFYRCHRVIGRSATLGGGWLGQARSQTINPL